MEIERYRRLDDLLRDALSVEPDRRARLVEAATENEASLREDLVRLLSVEGPASKLELEEIDGAFDRMAQIDARRARIAAHRLFFGEHFDSMAQELEIPSSAVRIEWLLS